MILLPGLARRSRDNTKKVLRKQTKEFEGGDPGTPTFCRNCISMHGLWNNALKREE
jgi:hypothetical protein